MTELARKSKMSPAAVTARVRRLEREGLIAYRLDVDPAALGLPVTAFVRVLLHSGQSAKVTDLARSMPEVSEGHRLTGEDSLLLKVHAPTVEHLSWTLDRLLDHAQVVTSVVLSTPIPLRALGLDDAERVDRQSSSRQPRSPAS